MLLVPGQGEVVNDRPEHTVRILFSHELLDATWSQFGPREPGADPHVHREHTDSFYVLEGECRWQIGEQLVHAKPGTYVFIPPGVPHNIGNASDKPARMIMTVSPPGHEHYFEELVKLVASGKRPDANAIGALRSRYDTEQLSALNAT